jgi:hypothetical protein
MEDQLSGLVCPKIPLYQRKPYLETPRTTREHIVDIVAISAIGMHFNLRVKENEAFTTSLYKLDRILEEREAILIHEIDQDPED